MSYSAMSRELDELREQVAELTRARENDSSQQKMREESSRKKTTVSMSETQATDVQKSDDTHEGDLSSHIQELVEALEEEIKETNPMTMLVVFALGILIGRLLPR